MANFFFIVITILMTITFSQYFIRKCYIGGQIFVLGLTLLVHVKQSFGTIIIVRVNGKPLFYNNYNSANIVLLSNLKFDLSDTESFNLAKRNGLKDSNFLTWTGVRCAVPSHLRIRTREVNKDHVRSLQFKIGEKIFDPALNKSRDFYGLLISSKATESRGFTKLKSKFSIDDVETKKAFSSILKVLYR